MLSFVRNRNSPLRFRVLLDESRNSYACPGGPGAPVAALAGGTDHAIIESMSTKPKLDPNKLYWGDNYRITCGKLRCAGMSAHFSGRTISGQRAMPVTRAELAALKAEGTPAKCETCGMCASDAEKLAGARS